MDKLKLHTPDFTASNIEKIAALRGVRHKFLTFNHAKNAFKSIKNKILHRILTRWVWQSCRSVIAMSC